MPFTDLDEFLEENLGYKNPFIEDRLATKLEKKRANAEKFFAEMDRRRRENPEAARLYQKEYRRRRKKEDPGWWLHILDLQRKARYKRLGKPLPTKKRKYKWRHPKERKKWKKWRTHKPKSATAGNAVDSEVK